MAFQYRVCFEDTVVPLETQTLDFKDLHELKGGDEDEKEFLTLNLKASVQTKEARWLLKALGKNHEDKLSCVWWRNHQQDLPLIREIKAAISSWTPSSIRMPRHSKAIVAISVRDQVILVQNSIASVVLAFEKGSEIQGLSWFVREISKDISNDEAPGAAEGDEGSAKRQKRSSSSLLPAEDEIVSECLRTLREHSNCKSVSFLPSRLSIKVIRQDKKTSEFGIRNLKSKRKEAIETVGPQAWQGVQNLYDDAVSSALAFLTEPQSDNLELQPIEDLAVAADP